MVVQQTFHVGNILPVAVGKDDAVWRTGVGRGVTEDAADDGQPHLEEDGVDDLSALQTLPTPSSRDGELAGVCRRDAEVVHHDSPTREQCIPHIVQHDFCKTITHGEVVNLTSTVTSLFPFTLLNF